jgi:hypothetical protein
MAQTGFEHAKVRRRQGRGIGADNAANGRYGEGGRHGRDLLAAFNHDPGVGGGTSGLQGRDNRFCQGKQFAAPPFPAVRIDDSDRVTIPRAER